MTSALEPPRSESTPASVAVAPEPAPAAEQSRAVRVLERIYLAYLLFAPLGATVMAFVTYRGPDEFVLFLLWLGGASAVAIYAAFVGLYFTVPRSPWRALVMVLDGPVWMIVAAVTLDGWRVLDLANWFFVSESLAIYLGIALVALRTLPGQMAASSAGIMVACIGVVCFAAGWSLWPHVFENLKSVALFAIGVAQSAIVAYRVTERDEAVRSQDTDATIILAAIGLFHVALGIGAALRFWLLH